MPATACCSLSRSLPGPWPGQHYFVQFIVLFYLCVTLIMYTVFIYVAGHWAQSIIPDS